MARKNINPNLILILSIIKKELYRQLLTNALEKKTEDMEEEFKQKTR